VLTVIGALVCQRSSATWSTAVAIVCLLVIFGLLCTTPPHAIRLPRWGSEMFVLLATAAVRRSRWPMPIGVHLLILIVLLILLRLWRKSPWWAVLYGWFPVY
jgi:hypothetical protein